MTRHTPRLALAVRKFLLSTFVIFTFVAYAIKNHTDTLDSNVNPLANPRSTSSERTDRLVMSLPTTVPNPPLTSPVNTPILQPTKTLGMFADLPTLVPTTIPTDVPPTSVPQPLPTSTPDGIYKDGTYVGPVVDAYYGNVQVEAIVQGGKIADVQFLDYPRDRRTSRFINQQATPWLIQEAVQVQSANVDLISGATFTSQAFVMSLDAALQQAHA